MNFQLSLKLICSLLFSLGFFCHGQHEDLLTIINSDETSEARQQKIDSFFGVHEKKIPKKILADCYHDLANKWHHELWWENGNDQDIQKAIQYTKKAFDIKLKQQDLEEGSLQKTVFNLGVFYSFNGDIYDAINSYLFVIENNDDHTLTQYARLELGAQYMKLGDFYKALDQLAEIIAIDETSEIYSRENAIDAYILKAETYSLMGIQGFSNEIHTNLRKAHAIIQLYGDEDYSFKSLRMNQFEGNRLVQTGNYEEAITYHERMLNDTINLFPEDLAVVNNSIAFSQIKLKNYSTALKHLNAAISLDDNYSSPYENLGDLFMEQNAFEKAIFNYQTAIVWLTSQKKEVKLDNLPTIKELEVAPKKLLLLNHIVTKANGWLKYYEFDENPKHLEHALKTFTLADELVDIIRFESTEQQSKLFWREKGASLYMQAVKVCYLLNRPKEAYYFMERNKALLLLEDVSNEQAKEIAQLPDEVKKREFGLKRAILLSENELQINVDSTMNHLANLKKEIYNNKKRYNSFIDSLETNFPGYMQFKKRAPIIPYQDLVDDYTSDKEVVLQYILNDEDGYGLLTSSEGTQFFKLENVVSLQGKLADLYSLLTNFASNKTKMSAYNSKAHQIFKELLPERVFELVKGKNLIVIADHALQQLPFEALVVKENPGKYLIEEVEVRYAYSISYLNAKEKIGGEVKGGLLGLAPVNFDSLQLPDLAFSGLELSAVENIYGGNIFLQKEASKSKLLNNLNNHGIIHLSTHADVTRTGNHWIAFSDEKLYLNEIYANKNQAEMVVLSACNTSLGEVKKGEGVMSLARGFFSSGAKSVVSSLWTINDKTSKEIMIEFYKGLNRGLTKSGALRAAKLKFIDKYRNTLSPSYWAALVVIGNDAPITTTSFLGEHRIWIALGLTFLTIFGILLFSRKKEYSVKLL